MLGEMESGALAVLARYGLPHRGGLYRRDGTDEAWQLIDEPASAAERWQEILDHPPEAGFRYLKVADVARIEQASSPDVQLAATVLDRIDDLKSLLGVDESDSLGEHNPALLMFWSTVELMAVLFDNRPNGHTVRAIGTRALEWDRWRREAVEMWHDEPESSARLMAKKVVEKLSLTESEHSVRRRLRGYRPAPIRG